MADEDTTQNDDTDYTDEQAENLLADAVNDDAGDGQDGDQPSGAQEQLRDAGKKAIDRMKEERNNARNELRSVQAKLKEYEDANKSESQRLQEAAEGHKSRAEKAEADLRRFQVAMDRAPEHATLAHVKAVAKRLHGDSDEELESDADELFGLVAPAPSDPGPNGATRVPSKPTERMPRGGGDPDEPPEETDPRKLAALVQRAR